MKEIDFKQHLALCGIYPAVCQNSWVWLEKELGRTTALKLERLTRPFFRSKKPSKKEQLAFYAFKAEARITAAFYSLHYGGLQAAAAALAPFLSAPKQILDLGCGSGILTTWIAKQNPRAEITAVDFSRPLLAEARRAGERLGIKNISFQEMDFTRQWPAGNFDLIVDSQALYLASGRKKIFGKAFRSLRSRGRLLSVSALPNARAAHFHCAAMRQAGFKIKSFTFVFYQDAEENGAYSVINAGKTGASKEIDLRKSFARALRQLTAA